jgi:4-amino-4-deoxy-L-arabinose transferase-like glycosyltransferase
LLFGLFAALAFLAKGNGIAVVLMCPLMILVSGGWKW